MTAILDHALRQWSYTPEMRIEDAYKWLFQATMGVEHAILDIGFTREWLKTDWDSCEPPMDGEGLFEVIRPDLDLGRVHLRVAKAEGLSTGQVLSAVLETSKYMHPDEPSFNFEWLRLKAKLVEDRLPQITITDWRRLTRSKGEGVPPLSHSKAYKRAYRPLYRVVLREFLK